MSSSLNPITFASSLPAFQPQVQRRVTFAGVRFGDDTDKSGNDGDTVEVTSPEESKAKGAPQADVEAEETSDGDGAAGADKKKADAGEPKTKKKMGIKGFLKTVLVSGLGIGLMALPIVLFPVVGGVWAIAGAMAASIPFIVAKDILDDYVSKNHPEARNYSDIKVLRKVLDERMRGFLEGTIGRIPLISREKKTGWIDRWMKFYNTKISGLLKNLGGDLQFSALFKDLPDKLKSADSTFGKLEVIMATVGIILKKTLLVAGKQGLSKRAATGGVWRALRTGKVAGAFFALALLAFNYFFKDETDEFEEQLDDVKRARQTEGKDAKTPEFA